MSNQQLREALFHARCDVCGWTIWPDTTRGLATGRVRHEEGGGEVDDLEVCERCIEVGEGVVIEHARWPDLSTVLDDIRVVREERDDEAEAS